MTSTYTLHLSERLSSAECRQQLRAWMQQCRQRTLTWFEGMTQATLCQQAHPDFSPVGWHLGHIGYTEALWILEYLANRPPLFSQYRRLFAADTLPKRDRQHLPPLADILDYLRTVRLHVFDYLEIAPLQEQERLWRWLLQHESQHCETIAIVLALQGNWQAWSRATPPVPAFPASETMQYIPTGSVTVGSDAIDALDNERPAYSTTVAGFWVDRTPVTCAQFREFMTAGGYDNPEWWTSAGWRWQQQEAITQPRYWSGRAEFDAHPVCGVSAHEAEAYATFVGKRLPTEVEWERAARWCLNQSVAAIDSSTITRWTTPIALRVDYSEAWLGQVWQWTSSWFQNYPDFQPYPYRGYSQAYFDKQHRVLRGSSWATLPWANRVTFRNWYHPTVREIFAGFRCVTR